MNKEEAKIRFEEIETYTHGFYDDVLIKKCDAKVLLDQLDLPKPVVPQFVAEWYEETDNPLDDYIELVEIMHKYDGKNPNYNYDTGMYKWIKETPNSIQIVVNMHQFGYTVEKEKLYTVKILGCTLFKMTSDNHVRYKLIGENETPSESKFSSYKFEVDLTEQEIKQADERLWQFAKEVTE